MNGDGDLPIQSPASPEGCGGYGRFGFVLAGLLLAGSGARGQICRFSNLAGAAAAAADWKAEGVSS
jgi:hypothetical protein